MRGITIRYEYAGAEAPWRDAMETFIAAIQNDPAIAGKFTYQVAVAQRGDTVQDVANRIGYNAARLASFNGLPLDTPLRDGELIALPEPLQKSSVKDDLSRNIPFSHDALVKELLAL